MAVAVIAGSLLVAVGAVGAQAANPPKWKEAATAAKVPRKIPAGVTLRLGDQLDYLKTVLSLGGQDTNFPYKVEYSAFVGGPPMLQAFQAGSIDSGFVASTPLIFAQAAKQDIKAVAAWAQQHGTYGLVTAPGNSSVKGWKSLKGKKVAYQQGTAAESVLLEGLDSVHLEFSDISPVNLPVTQISAALQSGSADAGISIEPLTSAYFAKNPTARQVARSTAITDRSSLVIATRDTLANPGKSAALADYITRLVKAYAYLQAHPELTTQAVYIKQYGLTPDRAAIVQRQAGTTSFLTLPGPLVKAQQRLADLYVSAGEIPSTINVKSEFDTRYNATVTAAQAP